jgi:hypothetical protein
MPLKEDDKDGGFIRLYRIDQKKLEEFEYRLDILKDAASEERSVGLSDIAALDTHRLFTLEKTFFRKKKQTHIKIYDVSLVETTKMKKKSIIKKLVLSLKHVPSIEKKRLDNLEGMCIGPRLANGNRTLIIVSDNNFSKSQVTQFLVFEIISII